MLAVVAGALAVLGAGCTTSSSSSSSSPATPALARPGPYPVGATTLDLGSAGAVLGERMATVFYPADAAKAADHRLFSYTQATPLPAALRRFVPAKYDTTITVDARVDAPASPQGPFPVVLFSHGFGASRLYYSHVLTGIASWGFVVVSADYLERGLVAQSTHQSVASSPAQDVATMFSSLAAAETASASAASPLAGAVDPGKVAAVGHSAGGQTAFDALDDPRVAVAVGWAPEGPSGPPAAKPVMILGAQGDIALTPAALSAEYQATTGPTKFVEVSGEGHDTYTDICPSIRKGGGLIGFALSLHLVSPQLAKLGANGCTARDAVPQQFWPIVQYYTVSELRSVLGTGQGSPSAAIPTARFPGFTVTYLQHP